MNKIIMSLFCVVEIKKSLDLYFGKKLPCSVIWKKYCFVLKIINLVD